MDSLTRAMHAPPTRLPQAALLLIACVGVSACGGSSQSAATHAPKNVCRQAKKAVQAALGPTTLRIAASTPADTECVLRAHTLKLDVEAQASPRAWEQFDTIVVHQAQAFGGSGSKDLPQDVAGLGYNAAWIPSSRKLVATNGTQSAGGSFLTVTITGRSRQGKSELKLAEKVATAALSVAPRGPSPGPAPS